MNRILGALLLVAAFAAAPLRTQSAATTRGTLYIVGDGPQPAALVREFVDLGGLGAQARNVWVTRDQAMTDSIARLLDGATGIWFSGGDQGRLADVLRGTRTERAIHARYASR